MVANREPEPYCGAMTTNRSAEDIRNNILAIECAAFGMGVPINAGQASALPLCGPSWPPSLTGRPRRLIAPSWPRL